MTCQSECCRKFRLRLVTIKDCVLALVHLHLHVHAHLFTVRVNAREFWFRTLCCLVVLHILRRKSIAVTVLSHPTAYYLTVTLL